MRLFRFLLPLFDSADFPFKAQFLIGWKFFLVVFLTPGLAGFG